MNNQFPINNEILKLHIQILNWHYIRMQSFRSTPPIELRLKYQYKLGHKLNKTPLTHVQSLHTHSHINVHTHNKIQYAIELPVILFGPRPIVIVRFQTERTHVE